MKRNPILIIILSIGLLLVCALCALTGYSTYTWLNRQPGGIRLWNNAPISAQVQESQILEVSGSTTLELHSDAGSITVTATETDHIEVDMTRTAWAATEEDARLAAENLPVNITQNGNRISIDFEQPDEITLVGGRGGMNSVDFTIQVPVDTAVILETSFGDISLNGTTGTAELSGSFGDLTVSQVTGALTMHSSQSALTVRDVNAGLEPVTLDTSFGDIRVNGLTGEDMVIRTSNGTISAQNLNSTGKIEIQDQFGDITLSQFSAARLSITSSNGRVEVEAGELEEGMEITNSFGKVTVRSTNADAYDLETSNGELSLEGCRGEINLNNSFGDILVTRAEAAILTIRTANGRIAFSGSLDPASAHSLENSFGDIQLTIPADSVFDIEFETQFGEIDSDLPITVSGALTPTSLQGTLNGGGTLLKATTSNGDITLTALVAER